MVNQMIVSDPQQFLIKLDEDTYANIENTVGSIDRFLSPGDKFSFSCDKSGRCCKNRFDNPIILFPYDVHRLRKNLKVSSTEFASKYGQKILGAKSRIPMMLLNFPISSNNHNKCVFLRSYGCKVHEDRPLVCRLFPVGRFIDTDMNSYFFLTQTAKYCNLGKGREYSIEEWLDEAQVEPYFEWNDKFHSLVTSIDQEKYKSLDNSLKAHLGNILYDMDSFKDKIPDTVLNHINSYEDASLHVSYRMAKRLLKML